MLIFGVDGGGEQKKNSLKSDRGTGWCLIQVDAVDDMVLPELMEHGQIAGGPDNFLQWVHEALEWTRAEVMVVENFRPMSARVDAGPLEIVGMVKAIGLLTNKKVVVREPSQRTLVSHDDLKANAMWPGGAGHADTAQAIRHVISWLISTGHTGTINLFAPDPG